MEPHAARFPLRYGDPWVDRLRAQLRNTNVPILIESEPNEAIRRLLEALATLDRPLLWIDYSDDALADESTLGNRFVDAINRATASKVLANGTPLSIAVAAFSRLIGLLGPFVIGVGGGHRVPGHVEQILALHDGQNRVVLVGAGVSTMATGLNCLLLRSDALRVQQSEAVWFSDGRISDADVSALLAEREGDYVAVVDAIRSRLGLPPMWAASQEGSVSLAASEFGLDPSMLAEALLRRKRFVEAFELMCASASDMVARHIDACGDAYFENGLFERFWFQMNRLEPAVIEDEKVMRWYYAAAMAVNRHNDVAPMVEHYLRVHEAPELRAQYAASRPSIRFLSETTRAVQVLESPITLRHHAFALSLEGFHEKAFEVLQRALRLADVLGNDQMVVAIGTDMCIALQRVGSFRESLWWGQWACQEYIRRDLRENYRRVSGLAALTFSKMIVGDDVGLRDMVDDIEVSIGLVGVPSYEGVVSTVADYLSIVGQQERAAELYGVLFDSATYDIAGLIAVDYVRCLIDLGRREKALQVGERVMALSRASSKYQRDCSLLAHGIALKGAKDSRAESVLSSSVEAFLGGKDAVRLCQACVQLADLHLGHGNRDAARAVVSLAGDRLLEVGDSGWRLLGGSGETLRHVRDLVASTPSGLDVSVLGSPAVLLFADHVDLTARQLEIVTVLAHRPGGLSLEGLAFLIYGDRAVLGTMKAAVSRLRSTIPLSSRPYKIGVPFHADFLDLLEHLKRGRVRQALNLYRGQLLPGSDAPAIVELREQIDESLRQAVLGSADPEAMLELANRTDSGDLGLLEEAYRHLPKNDPQSPLLRARIRQIRRDWESEGRLAVPTES